MMRKKVAGLTAVLLTVGMLAACGESTDTNEDLKQMKVDKYVTLGDYSNLSVSAAPAAVEQEKWDELLLAVYQSGVTADKGGITDRAVETGDTVIIDYEGKRDGVAFDGGTAQNANLTIGSGRFIEGFEDGLVGVMPGETVDLDLTFPDGYDNTELAGQEVVFTVTVHCILPGIEEMEDTVVASLEIDDVGTVEELRQYVYDYLMEEAEINYTYSVQDALINALMDDSEFQELPQTFLDSYRDLCLASIGNVAASYNATVEIFIDYYYNMSTEEYLDQYSEMQAKQEVMLQAVANREGLSVSDEELQEKLDEYASDGGFESVEEMMGERSREEYRNYFMTEKVLDYLMDVAEITE